MNKPFTTINENHTSFSSVTVINGIRYESSSTTKLGYDKSSMLGTDVPVPYFYLTGHKLWVKYMSY